MSTSHHAVSVSMGGAPDYKAVLFDFDGTVADTAPDLAAAANRLRAERDLAPLPLEQLRVVALHGARGLLRVALQITPEHPDYELLRVRFLDLYEERLSAHTSLFDGMAELLTGLQQAGLAWGIVTNKATRFAQPLVDHLGLAARCGVLVCGDTTPRMKPHPDPLWLAARTLGVEAGQCVYVGDDLRDVQAGRAAGMSTVAAAYGYCGDELPVHQWEADALIAHPRELWGCLGQPQR